MLDEKGLMYAVQDQLKLVVLVLLKDIISSVVLVLIHSTSIIAF